MAYYNYKDNKIEYLQPQQSEIWPDWDIIDCGCCAGIEWGGNTPKECDRCGGEGIIFKHRKSGVYAQYPGGEFV